MEIMFNRFFFFGFWLMILCFNSYSGLNIGGYLINHEGGVMGLKGPVEVAVSPDGKNVYAVTYTDNAIVWFLRENGILTYKGKLSYKEDCIPGLFHPTDIEISPDGKQVYVTANLYYVGCFCVFTRNTISGDLLYVKTIEDKYLGGVNHIAISPDGKKISVSIRLWFLAYLVRDMSNDAVFLKGFIPSRPPDVYSILNQNEAYKRIYGTPTSVVFAPQNDDVYISNAEGYLHWYRWDQGKDTLILQGLYKNDSSGIENMNLPYDIAINADGKSLFVASPSNGAICFFKRDIQNGNLTYNSSVYDGQNGVEGLYGVMGLSLSHDGKQLYAITQGQDENNLCWLDYNHQTDSLIFRKCLKNGTDGVTGLSKVYGIAISPDDKQIYCAPYGDDAISYFTRENVSGAISYSGKIYDGQGGLEGLEGVSDILVSFDNRHVYVAGTRDNAISWYERNQLDGSLTYKGYVQNGKDSVAGLGGISALASSHNGKYIYATGQKDNAISYFMRDPITGRLLFKGIYYDSLENTLEEPTSIVFTNDGKQCYVSSYIKSMIDWFDQDSITGLLKHKGNIKDGSDGIKTIVLTHEMNYCYSVGSQNYNSIGCYSRNKETGDLTFISKLVTCARVLTISADDNNLYLPTTEFDIQWFDRDVKTGELKFKNKIKDNVNGVDGLEFASDLSFDPDGRMLYVTAEYDSSIAWFLRNELTGDLEFKGCIKSSSCNAPFLAGATALAISPDGKNVYITSSYNSTIAWCSVTETNIVDVGKKGSAGNVYLRNGNLSLQLLTAVKSGLIRVFDTRGKLLNSFNLKNLNAGKHVFPILKNKIAAGSFFVELTIENHKQILPFINIR